ncbi:hypothetical protein CV014_18515 [Nostoc sp. CMAA1605]|nr:hypothetical protein [Nostoc sp. CMAA1605]
MNEKAEEQGAREQGGEASYKIQNKTRLFSDFSRDLENPSPNLSPCRGEALTFPPSLLGKGARGLGFALTSPHNVKSQRLF